MPTDRQRTVLHLSVVVTAVVFLVIAGLGAPLLTSAAPLGIVSLQFAVSPHAADLIVASWASVAPERVFWAHGLDVVLPVFYASSIVLASRRVAKGQPTLRAAASLASGAAITAAIADQVENLAMSWTLFRGASWPSVLVTLVAATVKFSMLMVAVGSLAVAVWTRRRLRRASR